MDVSAHGPDHIVDYLDTGYWRIHGTVVDAPIVRYGRTRVIRVTAFPVKLESNRSVDRIRLTVMGEATWIRAIR